MMHRRLRGSAAVAFNPSSVRSPPRMRAWRQAPGGARPFVSVLSKSKAKRGTASAGSEEHTSQRKSPRADEPLSRFSGCASKAAAPPDGELRGGGAPSAALGSSAIARATACRYASALHSSSRDAPAATAASTAAAIAARSVPSRVIRRMLSKPRRHPRRRASSCASSNAAPQSVANAPAAAVRSGSSASARTLARCRSRAAPSNGLTHESIAQHATLPSEPGSRITLPRFPSVSKSTGSRSALLSSTSNAASRPRLSNSLSPSAAPALPPCSSVGPRTNSRTATGSALASRASIAARRLARFTRSASCCATTTSSGMPAFSLRSARDQ